MTMSREEIVEKLVTTNHVNVEERRKLGRWVGLREVVAVIKRQLDRGGVFPPHALPEPGALAGRDGWPYTWIPGPYFEACILGRADDGYNLWWFGTTPRRYRTFAGAVLAYLRRDYVGREIDGIKVSWWR
jgi:hypothetical protein